MSLLNNNEKKENNFLYSNSCILILFCFCKWSANIYFPPNRNRFAEPTSVRIGIRVVRELQNLRIGIGIILVICICKLFMNYINIFLFYLIKKKVVLLTLTFFVIWKTYWANKAIVKYMHILYIFNIRFRYSWIL